MFARDYRSIGRTALQGNWALTIGVTLVAGLLGGSIGGGSFAGSSYSSVNNTVNNDYYSYYLSPSALYFLAILGSILLVYLVVAFILGGAVTLGLCQYNIDMVGRRTQPSFSTLFSKFTYFGKAFLLQFMITLLTALWTLLFIIPGIIAAYRYSMAPFLMAQNPNLGVMEAIALSKQMMSGNKGKLFCLDISFIGWAFLCVFTLGIGYLWLIPYMNASKTAFYLNLTYQLPGQVPPQAPMQQPPTQYQQYQQPPMQYQQPMQQQTPMYQQPMQQQPPMQYQQPVQPQAPGYPVPGEGQSTNPPTQP